MSSIVIKGNTSGQIELAAPDVAGSTTLTLPTGTANVLTDTAPKSGNVLQVVSMHIHSSTTQLTSSGAFHELSTNFRISITPKSIN